MKEGTVIFIVIFGLHMWRSHTKVTADYEIRSNNQEQMRQEQASNCRREARANGFVIDNCDQ
jgi:hypothetical protein